MIIDALALAAQLSQCAPDVGSRTMAAIVQVESDGEPFAIGDNTTRASYHPKSRTMAEALARRLLSAGHSVDLGIAQINDANLARLGLDAHTVFDTCTNLGAGAAILAEDYAMATRRFGAGQVALRHAIGMYNTGRLDAGAAYARRVLSAAGIQSQGLRPDGNGVTRREAANSRRILTVVKGPNGRGLGLRRVAPERAPIMIKMPPPSKAVVL
jgi:type IV secretion system protein VirB1